MHTTKYTKAAELLAREEARLTAELEEIRDELRRIRGETVNGNGHASTPVGIPTQVGMSCAEAIDDALKTAGKPLTAKEIEHHVLALGSKVRGKPAITSIRSVLHRRASAMGWKKTGYGQNVRWSKAAPKEAPDEESLRVD